MCYSQMSRRPGVHRGVPLTAQQRYSRSLPIAPCKARLFAPTPPCIVCGSRLSCNLTFLPIGGAEQEPPIGGVGRTAIGGFRSESVGNDADVVSIRDNDIQRRGRSKADHPNVT